MPAAVVPLYSAEDFATAFQNLLPTGRVWPRDPDALQTDFCEAMAPTIQRVANAGAGLIADAFPEFPVNLLPEWEATLGLPNPNYGPVTTLQQRQKLVYTKFIALGGQSVQYFLDLLTSLGYIGCTITQYAPFRAGKSRAGDPCYGAGWIFTWLITSPSLSVTYFRSGQSSAGDALYTINGGTVLEGIIEEFAPAHTNPLFAITS
jgi:uncharacterized protein YmfQ (DUF2313 family)